MERWDWPPLTSRSSNRQELNPTSTIFTHQKPDWAPDYPGANGGGPA